MNITKFTPSQWNSFRNINLQDSFFVFKLTLTTRSLTLPELKQDQEHRLFTIKELFENGLSAKQIADHLNDRNHRTPSGKKYYPELVWVTNNKFIKRLQRRQYGTVTVSDQYIVATRYGGNND